jgi:hypothetical protein
MQIQVLPVSLDDAKAAMSQMSSSLLTSPHTAEICRRRRRQLLVHRARVKRVPGCICARCFLSEEVLQNVHEG